jgi:hypothetical protein
MRFRTLAANLSAGCRASQKGDPTAPIRPPDFPPALFFASLAGAGNESAAIRFNRRQV